MSTSVTYRTIMIGETSVGEFHLRSESGVNPLSAGVVSDISSVLRQLEETEPPHVIVFRATGRCFSAGADLKEIRDGSPETFRRFMADILDMYALLSEVRKPVVSVVHADARGGGAALAFFSDFVIAAEGARFALPEAHRGLAGGGYLMPRLVGKHRAAEMVLLGRTYTAQEMHRMGLVTEVCAVGAIDEAFAKLCEELGAISPGAFAVGKRSLAAGLAVDLRAAMATHVEAQTEAFVRARAEGLL